MTRTVLLAVTQPLHAEVLERAGRLYDVSRIVRTELVESPAPGR